MKVPYKRIFLEAEQYLKYVAWWIEKLNLFWRMELFSERIITTNKYPCLKRKAGTIIISFFVNLNTERFFHLGQSERLIRFY